MKKYGSLYGALLHASKYRPEILAAMGLLGSVLLREAAHRKDARLGLHVLDAARADQAGVEVEGTRAAAIRRSAVVVGVGTGMTYGRARPPAVLLLSLRALRREPPQRRDRDRGQLISVGGRDQQRRALSRRHDLVRQRTPARQQPVACRHQRRAHPPAEPSPSPSSSCSTRCSTPPWSTARGLMCQHLLAPSTAPASAAAAAAAAAVAATAEEVGATATAQ